jgi:hypothetical protein
MDEVHGLTELAALDVHVDLLEPASDPLRIRASGIV